jgi:hypothetical protein
MTPDDASSLTVDVDIDTYGNELDPIIWNAWVTVEGQLLHATGSTVRGLEAAKEEAMAAYNKLKSEPANEYTSEEIRELFENVDHPAHYGGKIECIDAIEAATESLDGIEAFCTGNAIKYLWRWKRKGGTEDLQKAKWYIDRILNGYPPEAKSK